MDNLRIGNGYDVHAFSEGRDLFLGGVKIPFNKGLAGHSDADVLIHAIMDALLGAAGMRDIGTLFPDTDSSFRGISSVKLLSEVFAELKRSKYRIINLDSIIICEKPKISPHIENMKKILSEALGGLAIDRIGIKATTSERLGFTGREEGIAASAVALICKN